MYDYKIKVKLSEQNKEALQRFRDGKLKAVSIVLLPSEVNTGEDVLALTKAQFDAANKAVLSGRAATIRMSGKQLNMQVGGFIGALLSMARSALPMLMTGLKTAAPALALAGATGAISGATSAGARKAVDSIGGNGVGGQSFFVPEAPVTHKRLDIKPMPFPLSKVQFRKLTSAIQSGNGVTLKMTGKQLQGHGQRGGFAWMLPLVASLVGSAMAGKGMDKKNLAI
jgi:hypothetical protein